MSKFKVGDKVMVKYIPGVWFDFPEQMVQRYPELGEARTITSIDVGCDYYLDETFFHFTEDSLQLVSSAPRTLLGLETELHILKLKMQEIEAQLNSMKEQDD